jgi:transposase
MYIPYFLRFDGYETRDIREFREKPIEVHLHRKHCKPFECYKCRSKLQCKRGQYRLKLKHLPLADKALHLIFWRWQGHCPECKKARSEHVDFVAKETPHMTKDMCWWLGKLCEISAVSNAAEFYDVSAMTTWRVDFKRMKIMLQYYKIPKITHISVDEVYARKKGPKGESRNKRFFTVITDLKTRRVVWVSESRDKEALDQFFELIGETARSKIQVVAMDQYEAYRASVRENCPNAKVVWDRFHLMQSLNETLNDVRKDIFNNLVGEAELQRLIRGKYKYIFLKRDRERTITERKHLDEVMKRNEIFVKLELIKERFIQFFDEDNIQDAYLTFFEIGAYVSELRIPALIDWYMRLKKDWGTIQNYFEFRVSSAVSEGINNVIKTLKRKAYGYRNMTYFRLKIMQICGYLNSKFIPNMDFVMDF